MSVTVRLGKLAEKDILKGYVWYEDQRNGWGDVFLNAVIEKLNQITGRPYSYGSKLNENYRQALLKNFPYLIIYRINIFKSEVFVTGVRYAMMSPKKIIRRL